MGIPLESSLIGQQGQYSNRNVVAASRRVFLHHRDGKINCRESSFVVVPPGEVPLASWSDTGFRAVAAVELVERACLACAVRLLDRQGDQGNYHRRRGQAIMATMVADGPFECSPASSRTNGYLSRSPNAVRKENRAF
jgi:hypothetical protein